MEQVQAAVAAQASQFQAQVADLGPRIKKQDESVRRLELELDEHLERIAAEIVSDARTQLEGAANAVLKELQIRGANEFAGQLDEACGQLRTIQNRIENSFSGSLSAQIAEALQSFGQDIEKLAQQSVERWRMALARDLNSVAKTLGEQFRLEAGSGSGEKPNPPAV
jgi:phage-related minor tail protein